MENNTFLITVDTEGDNLWNWHNGDKISTENCLFIPRFQELCEKYGFVPTYLTNYEMALDERWVSYAKQKQRIKKCEIGLHVHAWNSPPEYHLENRYGGNSYITEYPKEIIYNKIEYLNKLLQERFECPITSARSGRWATNESYFEALSDTDVYVDCSITPGIDNTDIPGCSVPHGHNYRNETIYPTEIFPGIIEIPMTTRIIRWKADGSVRHKAKTLLLGEEMWLRPIKLSQRYLEKLTDTVLKENQTNYLQFMIHSSELMPGGNPYFKTSEDIEKLFGVIEWYFDYVSNIGYRGMGITDYADTIRGTI